MLFELVRVELRVRSCVISVGVEVRVRKSDAWLDHVYYLRSYTNVCVSPADVRTFACVACLYYACVPCEVNV